MTGTKRPSTFQEALEETPPQTDNEGGATSTDTGNGATSTDTDDHTTSTDPPPTK